MKRLIFLAFAAAVAAAGAAAGASGQASGQGSEAFFVAIEDLPVMPGMTEEQGSEVVFDSPEGRIVETYATGPMRARDVLAFYAETLPQLGWRPDGSGRFRREDEVLSVEFPGRPGWAVPLTVRFRLQPAPR